MKIKINKLISILIVIMFLLTACGEQGDNSSKNNSKNEEILNSSSVILSPDDLDSSDPDVIVSKEQNTENVSSEISDKQNEQSQNAGINEYPLETFPEINVGDVSESEIFLYGGGGKTNILGEVNAKKLAKFINDSKFERIKKETNYSTESVAGCSLSRIVFTYKSGKTMYIYLEDGAVVTIGGSSFKLKSSSIRAFIRYVLGVDVTKSSSKPITKEVEVIPELQTRLAFNTKADGEVHNGAISFPKISANNLSSATILTTANTTDTKKVTLDKKKSEALVNFINNNCKFQLTDFTNEDFAYDYGDYFRIVFLYNDGSQVQISYDGYYHISANTGYYNVTSGNLVNYINRQLNYAILYSHY